MGNQSINLNRAGGKIMEENNMTQTELILYLETLAELIEAKAQNVEEATAIIRDKADKLK